MRAASLVAPRPAKSMQACGGRLQAGYISPMARDYCLLAALPESIGDTGLRRTCWTGPAPPTPNMPNAVADSPPKTILSGQSFIGGGNVEHGLKTFSLFGAHALVEQAQKDAPGEAQNFDPGERAGRGPPAQVGIELRVNSD